MRVAPTSTAAVAAAVAAVVLAACGGAGDVRSSRSPDAVGTVTSVAAEGEAVLVGFAPDPGYEYFEGTTFAFAERGALQTAEGTPATVGDVAVGDRLDVWVEACAESFPVQCPEPLGRLAP